MAHRWSISLLVASTLSVGCGSASTSDGPASARRAAADGGGVDAATFEASSPPTDGGVVDGDVFEAYDAAAAGGGLNAGDSGPPDADGADSSEPSVAGPSACVLGTSTIGDCVLM
jgi:hypothetical protein